MCFDNWVGWGEGKRFLGTRMRFPGRNKERRETERARPPDHRAEVGPEKLEARKQWSWQLTRKMFAKAGKRGKERGRQRCLRVRTDGCGR